MVILARRENSRNSSSKSSSQFSVDRPAPTPVLEVVQGRNRSSQQGSERQRCRQCRSKLPRRAVFGARRPCYDEATSGRSAVWLAHLVWDQGVGGSNPLAPIKGHSAKK